MPPKKAKGKANKLAKMSDEERARYLQHRADMEEEARRRKQELIARYMKNKLNKEEIFSKINLAKINQNWRFLLRKLKVKDMEQELQVMVVSFTRMVDSKNAIISRLMTSLDESEEQYSRMLQSHMEMISHFLAISADRLKFFHDNFEQQRDHLTEKWEEELQTIEFNQRESEYNLQLISYQQDENMKSYTDESTTAKAHSVNDLRIKFKQELNKMKIPIQLHLEKLWNEMRSTFTEYVNYHNPKIEQYRLLRQRDSTFQKEINQHMDQLLATSDIISQHQQQWESIKEEHEFDAKVSRDKRDEMTNKYTAVKLSITESHARDKEQISTLSVESSKALKKLETVKTKLKKIILLESTCRKYEIEGEKVLPWTSKELQTQQATVTVSTELTNDINALDLLENFWFKVNRVTVHATALKAECDSLKQETKYLKDCLKNFLLEATLGDVRSANVEVTGRPATTRMFKLSCNLPGSCEPVIKRPVTCIEGGLSNAVRHKIRSDKWRLANLENQKIVVRRHCW